MTSDEWGRPQIENRRGFWHDAYWHKVVRIALIMIAVMIGIALVVFLGLHFGLVKEAGSPVYPSQAYSQVQAFTGSSFFDNFDYFTAMDPTNGFVEYLSADEARASNLTATTSNSVVIKAGSTATQSGVPSIRIQSRMTFDKALIIADIAHMPSVCGSWPAFWTCDTNNWPNNGEIDILEGINDWTSNQIALHTSDGCNMRHAKRNETGSVITTECRSRPGAKDYGCAVKDTANGDLSYGANFNANNGGVYAMDWRANGIRVWFFPRNKIPKDVKALAPTMRGWGTPAAEFPNSHCDIETHFKQHHIIFDLTFCGDFAGDSARWLASTCSQNGLYKTCEEYISKNTISAYWEINGVWAYKGSS